MALFGAYKITKVYFADLPPKRKQKVVTSDLMR